jgi:hypothetical protein
LGTQPGHRIAGERLGDRAGGPTRYGKVRDTSHRRRGDLDRHRGEQGTGQPGAEEQTVQDERAEQGPAKNADAERSLGHRMEVHLGSGESADQHTGDSRQEITGVEAVLVYAPEHPLACQPPAKSDSDRQEDSHQDLSCP